MDSNEYQIVESIRRGQKAIQEAMVLLVERYKQIVYQHCFFLLRDVSQAQTIAEQTFFKVPEALLKYKEGRLEVLLLRIATELCATERSVIWSTEWGIDEEEQEQQSKLSENDRILLYLRRQELKWKEIASILGISEAAARQRGVRVIHRLELAKGVPKKTRNHG